MTSTAFSSRTWSSSTAYGWSKTRPRGFPVKRTHRLFRSGRHSRIDDRAGRGRASVGRGDCPPNFLLSRCPRCVIDGEFEQPVPSLLDEDLHPHVDVLVIGFDLGGWPVLNRSLLERHPLLWRQGREERIDPSTPL